MTSRGDDSEPCDENVQSSQELLKSAGSLPRQPVKALTSGCDCSGMYVILVNSV